MMPVNSANTPSFSYPSSEMHFHRRHSNKKKQGGALNRAPLPLIKSFRIRSLLAWSISLDSTFNTIYWREKMINKVKNKLPPRTENMLSMTNKKNYPKKSTYKICCYFCCRGSYSYKYCTAAFHKHWKFSICSTSTYILSTVSSRQCKTVSSEISSSYFVSINRLFLGLSLQRNLHKWL